MERGHLNYTLLYNHWLEKKVRVVGVFPIHYGGENPFFQYRLYHIYLCMDII